MSDNIMSSYMQYLPEIYQEDEFLGNYLKIFEKVLSGIEGDSTYQIGIEEVLDKIHEYFDPRKAPPEFLKWMSNWVALDLNEKWSHEMIEEVINKIVPLYKKRGTVEGLTEFLSWDDMVAEGGIAILEWLEPIRIKDGTTLETSLVLDDSMVIDGGYQDYFKVKIALDREKIEEYFIAKKYDIEYSIDYSTLSYNDFIERDEVEILISEKEDILNIIIEDEKPAHTIHKLEVSVAEE